MPIRLVAMLLVLVILALLADIDYGQSGRVFLASSTPTVQASIRSGSDPLPAGCGLDEIVRLLSEFLHAFNHGDAPALPSFFPRVAAYPDTTLAGFQWYSVTDQNGHFVTHDPAELPAYFAARHDRQEQLQLLGLELATGWHAGVDIAFRLSRTASDLPPHEAVGKGAIDCDEHTIFVWSMAQDMPVISDRATPQPGVRT